MVFKTKFSSAFILSTALMTSLSSPLLAMGDEVEEARGCFAGCKKKAINYAASKIESYALVEVGKQAKTVLDQKIDEVIEERLEGQNGIIISGVALAAKGTAHRVVDYGLNVA